MKFEVQSSVSLVFLSIMNMCLCLQDFAEKTLNSLSSELIHARRHQQQLQNTPEHHAMHAHQHQKILDNAENFLLIDYLADGELERRIHYNGITGKETTIGNSRYVIYFSIVYLCCKYNLIPLWFMVTDSFVQTISDL